MPGMPGDIRRRSNTVASTGSDGADASQLDMGKREMSPARHFSGSKPASGKSKESPDSTPVKQPPDSSPVKQPLANDSPSPHHDESMLPNSNHSTPELSHKDLSHHGSTDNLIESYADMGLEDADPVLPAQDGGNAKASSAVPDPDQVLFWSPEVVGMWLGSVGLSQHANNFKEKEIKGWMMFDLDSSKLKVSHLRHHHHSNITLFLLYKITYVWTSYSICSRCHPTYI